MRMNDWHRKQVSADPEYARAAQLVDLAESLADIVVTLRIQAGISQTELASLGNTTQATISSIETGNANPRADTISRVISALMSQVASHNAGPAEFDFEHAGASQRPAYSFDAELLATTSREAAASGVNRVLWQDAGGPSPVLCAA